jgi:hypothetical protein
MRLSRAKNRRTISVAIMTFALAMAGPDDVVMAMGLKQSVGMQDEIAAMAAGDQLVLSAYDGSVNFAGHSVQMEGFTGILGFSSDVAYVVTIKGTAETAKKKASAGRMILLAPFGEKPDVERFDAQQLGDSWTQSEKIEFAGAYAALEAIAKRQARGIFLGSLGRTRFNVAASGLASNELARRSVVSGKTAQEVRFGVVKSDRDVGSRVVSRFLKGLAEGDAESVAQLMDPLPFGLSDMRGEPGQARLIAAQRLIYAHNWTNILNDAVPQMNADTGVWTLTGTSAVEITLRNSVDIPFVKSIRIGGGL